MLRNDLGMSVAAIDYGHPDRDRDARPPGKFANVVLESTRHRRYGTNQRRYGAVIGRYAGRVTDARFTLDGQPHQLEAGRNNMTLSARRFTGYDKRL